MKEAEFNKQKELDSSLNNLTDFKSYVDKFLPAQSKKSDDELNSEHSTIEDSLIIDEDKKEKGILEPTMSAEDVKKYLPLGYVKLYGDKNKLPYEDEIKKDINQLLHPGLPDVATTLKVPKELIDGLGLQYAISPNSAIDIIGNHSGNTVYLRGDADLNLFKQRMSEVLGREFNLRDNPNDTINYGEHDQLKDFEPYFNINGERMITPDQLKKINATSHWDWRTDSYNNWQATPDMQRRANDTRPTMDAIGQERGITSYAPYPTSKGGEMKVPLSYTYYGGMAIPNSVLKKMPRKVGVHQTMDAGARLRGKDATNNLEQTLGRDMPNEWNRALNVIGVSKDNERIKYGFFTIDESTNEVIFCFPKWVTITSNTRDLDDTSISCLIKRFRKTEQKILPSGLVKKTKYLSTKQNGNGREYSPDGKWEGNQERSEFTRDELLGPLPDEVASYNDLLWDGVHYQNIIPTENGAEVKESAPVSFSAYMESIISELKEYPSVNGISTSDDEDAIYDMLVEKYGKSDIERQYKDEDRYPYECDFYIKSEDLFIEYLKHWTHGRRKYNPDDPSCQDDVKWLEGEAKDNAFYERCLRQWTEKDPEKFQTAEENGIKLLVFYNIREFLAWYENPELTYEEYKDPDPLQYDSDAYFASKAKGQNTNGNDRPKNKD